METLNKINGKFIINKVQRKDFGLHNGWLFIDLALGTCRTNICLVFINLCLNNLSACAYECIHVYSCYYSYSNVNNVSCLVHFLVSVNFCYMLHTDF